LAKRLSVKQKEDILSSFADGETIDVLSNEYSCSKLTISRNLKKILGEKEYKKILIRNESKNTSSTKKGRISKNKVKNNLQKDVTDEQLSNKKEINNEEQIQDSFQFTPFTEIIPLDQEIDNVEQKDLSSIPISDIDFPETVYMIVDKTIELETKLLKDYPDWHFLSNSDLNRKTIEIYLDLKIAKRFCNKDQKVIKVPNPNVFKIVAPILISRGISRIISDKNLIAL
jgi:hypothetical protein